MKKLILLSFLVLFLSESISQTKEFTIGYSGMYPTYNTATWSPTWSWYNELNVNLWQGWGVGEVNDHGFVLNKLYDYNMKGYFQPDTLMQYALGKMNIHQAENVTSDSFRYTIHNSIGSDYSETFMGETVKGRFFNADSVPSNDIGIPVKVLSNLRENGIQSFSGLVLDPKKQWRWDNIGQYDNSWYVKPRMRIDSVDAFGSVKNVMKIVVRAYNGDIILEKSITTAQFRTSINGYDGRYIEDYLLNIISVPGDTTLNGINKGFPPGLTHMAIIPYLDSCKVDFEIHWYREVSVWIDYVKIMDEPAYLLFNPDEFVKRRMKVLLQKS